MRGLRLLRIVLFLTALVVPLATMGGTDGALSNEQRTRVARPDLAKAGAQYPEQFDAYFRDNFGWRDRLIRWHHLFKFHFLRQSPVDNVIVGRDGWLFYAASGDGVDIRDFGGRWPHSDSDVEAWLTHQDARVEEYAELGARYLVALAPNKHTVYPEYVPARYGPHAPGLLEEIRTRLSRHPQLDVVDLREALLPHRDAQLYYRGDSHWNAQGAFRAAQAITDALRARVPAVGSVRDEDYILHTGLIDSGDLVNMLALGIQLNDRSFAYERRSPGARLIRNEELHRVWEQPGTNLPKAVLLADSYGATLSPILADAFSRLHYYVAARGGPDANLVRQERPDVVILLTVERYLPSLGIQ
jgi:alginate O-acetyltransferase complex protein AlgJ